MILTGCITVLLGACWVLLWALLSTGINDSEVGNIKRSGQPSNAGKIIWKDWMNGGFEGIVPFNTDIVLHGSDVKAVRFGVGKNWVCSFGIYQMKYHLPDGTTTSVYGYGPNWGASMQMALPWAVFIVGAVITMFGVFGMIKQATISDTELDGSGGH